jgi:hypothetical protein
MRRERERERERGVGRGFQDVGDAPHGLTPQSPQQIPAQARAGSVRTIYYGVNFPVTHSKIPMIQSTMDDRR